VEFRDWVRYPPISRATVWIISGVMVGIERISLSSTEMVVGGEDAGGYLYFPRLSVGYERLWSIFCSTFMFVQ